MEETAGAHSFLQRQAGSLAQQMATLHWKEASDSRTSYLTSQDPFLQLCKMGGDSEKMSEMLDRCGVKKIENKFLARSRKHGSGAQEKGSTGRTEQRIHNIKEMVKAFE